MFDLTGRTIAGGEFRLDHKIGSGGFAEVYLGSQPKLGRTVAVKILWDAGMDQESLQRFEGEARAIASLEQRNIVRILMYGSEEGFHYSVMNLLYGTLKDLLETSPRFPMPETLYVVRGVLEGLETAHGQAIAHRDIKPENIMFNNNATPTVTDFGLVRRLDNTLGLTQDGSFLGTPLYMSPEQVDPRRREDTRSDLYSFGILLYELLTGKTPYHEMSFFEVCEAHRSVDPPRPSSVHPASPEELDPIVMRCLEKDVDKRYQTAGEILADFDALSSDIQKQLTGDRERIKDIRRTIEVKWQKLKDKEGKQTLPIEDVAAGKTKTPGVVQVEARGKPSEVRATVLADDDGMPAAVPEVVSTGRRIPAWSIVAAAVVVIGVGAGIAIVRGGGGEPEGGTSRAGQVLPTGDGGEAAGDPAATDGAATGTQGTRVGQDRAGGNAETQAGDNTEPGWVRERGDKSADVAGGSSGTEDGGEGARETPADAPKQDVRVAIYDKDSNEVLHIARVHVNGEFIAENGIQTLHLAPGTYDVQVTCVGYETQTLRIEVKPGSNPPRKIYLEAD